MTDNAPANNPTKYKLFRKHWNLLDLRWKGLFGSGWTNSETDHISLEIFSEQTLFFISALTKWTK